MTTSTVSTALKSARGAVARSGRRTKRRHKSLKTGMISTIHRDPTVTRSINIAKRRYRKYENGKIGFILTAWLVDEAAAWKVKTTAIGRK